MSSIVGKMIKYFLFKNQGIKQTLIKNTFWLVFAEGVSRLFSFGLTLLVARYLSVEGYGKLCFAIAFVGTFSIIADFGFSTMAIRDIAKDPGLTRKYAANIATIKILLGIITIGIIFVVINFLGKDLAVRQAVYLLAIFSIIQSFTLFFQSVFRAFEKMEYEALTKLIFYVSLFIGSLATILMHLKVSGIALAYVLASIISFISTVLIFNKKFTAFSFELDFKFCKKLFKGALYIFFTSVLFAVYYKVDIILISIFKTDRDVGLYSAAFNFIFALSVIPTLLVGAVFPFFAKNINSMKKIFKTSNILLFFLMLIVISPIYVFRLFLVRTLYGEGYVRSVDLFLPLCLGIVIFSVAHLNYFYLYGNREEKTAFGVASLGMVMNIFFNLMLIPKYGIIGSAYASLMTEVVVLLPLLKTNLRLTRKR